MPITFDSLDELEREEAERRAREAQLALPKVDPDGMGRAMDISRRRDAPPLLVASALDEYEQLDRLDGVAAIAREEPAIGDWLSIPENAALAADDRDGLARLSRAFRDTMAGYRRVTQAGQDALVRAPLSELLAYPGDVAAGIGELYALGDRATQRAARAVLPDAVNEALSSGPTLPWWLNPGEVLQRVGRSSAAEYRALGVPEERQNVVTDVTGGAGQLVGMAAQATVAPQSMVPSLFGLGAGQQAAQAREAGVYGSDRADAAIASGAAVTGVLERLSVWNVLDRLPPKIKNNVTRWLADKAVAAGVEFGQEATEAVGQNVVTQQLLDPEQEITEGVVEQGGIAAGSAALVRTLFGVGRRSGDPAPEPELTEEQIRRGNQLLSDVLVPAAADAERLKELASAMESLKVAGRDRAATEALVQGIADRTSEVPSHVYLNAEQLVEYFQEQGEDPRVRIAEMMGSDSALEDAVTGLGDLVVPIGRFATSGLQDEGLRNLARLAPERASNAELAGYSIEELEAQYLSPLADDRAAASDPAAAAEDPEARVAGELEAIIGATGRYDQSSAAAMSRTLARAYARRAGRLSTGQTAYDLFSEDNLRILSEEPGSATARRVPVDVDLDPFIDAVMAGDESEAPTHSIVQAVRAAGGINPSSVGGGDLAAMGLGRMAPGVLNNNGMTVERMAETLADNGWGDVFQTKDEFGRPDYRELLELLGSDARVELDADTPAAEAAAGFRRTRDEVAGAINELRRRGVDVDGVGRPVLREMVLEELGREYDQAAYHGTPHTVDRFSLQKIGTGEGQQAFGWGLYFASQRDVADYYRRALTGIARNVPASMGDQALRAAGGDRGRAVATLTRRRDALPEAARANTQAAIDWLRRGQDTGQLYQVDVPEDSDLLNWDVPLSEQPEKVREAVRKAYIDGGYPLDEAGEPVYFSRNPTGEKLYASLGGINGAQAASEKLFAAGIPGLRYLDGTSRQSGEGSHNYVIWDEAAIGEPEVLFQSRAVDEATGLPLNPDGTVTVYHHTSAAAADEIRQSGRLRAAAEPDVYVTTRRETDTGYGDTAVAIRVDPSRLEIDDEFPNGRRDFRLSVGRPGGSMRVTVEPERLFQSQDQAQTPEFQQWFGDSKVVEADGSPQVVYHTGGFSGDGALRLPVFFTEDADASASYSANVDDGRATTIAAYLKIENPASEEDIFRVVRGLIAEDPDAFPYSLDEVDEGMVPAFEFITPESQSAAEDVIARLVAEGFDGARVADLPLDQHRMMDSWVVFGPGQIRAAADTSVFYQRSDRPFYSALAQSVEQAKGAPKRGTADQWKQWLDGAQRRGEFRQAEREWLGLDAWLSEQDGPITRDAIGEFVRANELTVEEKLLGPPADAGDGAAPFDASILDRLPFQAVPDPTRAGEWMVDGPNGPAGVGYRSEAEAERAAYDYAFGYLRSQPGAVTLPRLAPGFVLARVTAEDVADFGLNDDQLNTWGIYDTAPGRDDTPGDYLLAIGDAGMSYPRAMDAAVARGLQFQADAGITIVGNVGAVGAAPQTDVAPYASMTAPGGSNYRVLLLKMPPPAIEDLAEDTAGWTVDRRSAQHAVVLSPGGEVLDNIWSDNTGASDEQIIARAVRRRAEIRASDSSLNFTDGHFEPNTVAHVRFDERVDADGKRVLFINELQSDWHQQGRRKGYQGRPAATYPDQAAMAEAVGWTIRDATPADAVEFGLPDHSGFVHVTYPDGSISLYGREDASIGEALRSEWRNARLSRFYSGKGDMPDAEWQELSELVRLLSIDDAPGQAVPDAPFKTTWPELVMKRMVRWAAENGFDRVAWPTAEMVPDIERWGTTLTDIKASPEMRQRFGAIIDRYAVDLPRVAKALAKKWGGSLTTSDLQGAASAETMIEPPPSFEPVDDDGIDDSGEMPSFPAGQRPLEALTRVRMDGVEREVSFVLHGEGVTIQSVEPGTSVVFIPWSDIATGEAPENSAQAHEAFKDAWNAATDADAMSDVMSLWDAEAEVSLAPLPRRGMEVPAIEITPAMRDAALAGMPLFQQNNASITFDRLGAIIRLGETADLTSLHHETGHLFLDWLSDDAFVEGADPTLAEDLDAFLAWRGKDVRVADGPAAVRAAIEVADHEAFARGYETYLAEGKAPTAALADLFARFRSWMLAIYGALRSRHVDLSDDMRRVYDRLFAADAEAEAATGEAGFHPLPDAVAGLVGDVRWQEYQKKLQRARDEASANLQASVLQPVFREATAEWKAELEKMRATVLADAMQDPAHRARSILARGELPDGTEAPTKVSLDAAALKAEFGADFVKDRLRGLYRNKDGQPPLLVADILGFPDVRTMVDALANTPPINEWVRDEAQRRLRALKADPATDGTLPQKALEAVHRSQRLDALEAELAMVAELAGQPVPPPRVLGAVARSIIARTPLRSLRPNDYLAAERRAANEATRALSKDRPQMAVALMAKRRQVMNAQLYRAALDAQARAEKWNRYLSRFTKTRKRAALGKVRGPYLEQIDAIMEQLDLRPASAAEVQRRQSLVAFVAEAEKRGEAISVPPALLAQAGRINSRDLTFEQMRGLVDTIRQIDHLARTKGKLMLAGEARRLAEVDALNAASVQAAYDDRPPGSGDIRRRERLRAAALSTVALYLNAGSLARDLDGDTDGGAVWNSTVRPIQESVTATEVALQDMQKRLAEIYRKHYSLAELRAMRKPRIKALDGSMWSLERILALAGNRGNPGNWEAILTQERTPMSLALVDDLLAKLGRRDWQLVQDLAGEFERVWPMIAERERDKTGLVPERVEFSPFEVMTTDGPMTLPGWYWPLVPERHASRADSKVTAEELAERYDALKVGRSARAQTKNGHAIERVGFGGRPVKLELSVVQETLRESLRDVILGPTVNAVDRVLRGRRLRRAADRADKAANVEALQLWLADVAVGEMGPRTLGEQIAHRLRVNASLSLMAFKVSTAMIQPTGFAQTIPVLGEKWMGVGLKRMTTMRLDGPEGALAYVDRVSPGMALRAQGHVEQVKEVNDALDGKLVNLQKYAWWMMGRTQRVVDVATFLGAEAKGMELFDNDVEKARAFAFDLVERAQGSNAFEGKGAFQRGTASSNTRQTEYVKSMTFMLSYMMSKGAMVYLRTKNTSFKDPHQVARWTLDMTLLFVVETLILTAMRGGWPDDEDEDGAYLDDFMAWLGMETVSGVLGTVPGVAYIASDIRGYAPRTTTLAAVEAFGDAVEQIKQGEFDAAAAKSLSSLAGVAFGFPSSQTNVAIDAMWRVREGEDVPIKDFFVRPPYED